ncbi:MAG: NifU family protein [Bacteroidota bacterium]|nr:NifU family protein [Bacteroidota bacterium]
MAEQTTQPAKAIDEQRLRTLIAQEIAPYVEMHGGAIELVELCGTTVRVRLRGACEQCSAAVITLHVGIERLLRRALDPAIRVEQVL